MYPEQGQNPQQPYGAGQPHGSQHQPTAGQPASGQPSYGQPVSGTNQDPGGQPFGSAMPADPATTGMPVDPGMGGVPPAGGFGGQPTLTGPPPKSHAPLYVLAILVVAGLFGSLVAIGAAAAFDDSVDTEAKKRLRERTTGTGKIGQKMIDQRLEFTVNSVECGITQIPSDGFEYEPDGQFCAAEITMKNRADESRYMSIDAVAETSANEKIPYDDSASQSFNDPSDGYWTSEFKAGESVTRSFVWDIPAGDSITRLHLNDDKYSDKNADITVKVD